MDKSRIVNTVGAENATKTSRNTSLLRVGVVFLAVVSFFTTANGMKEYIFKDYGPIAYAASAAVQSILLALSMNLPGYLAGIWNLGKKTAPLSFEVHDEPAAMERGAIKRQIFQKEPEGNKRTPWPLRLILCLLIIALTIVSIFCSSWFSYVYIAEVIHRDSWDADSELLVQQTYRAELYSARDYAHAYRTYLEESVGEDILILEQQAQEIEDSKSSVEVNWDQEETDYLSDNGTAASYMSPVILAMRNAMQTGNAQDNRDLAAIAISDAKLNISARIAVIQENLDRINANLANYNTQIANLTSRINNATEETDITPLNNAVANLTRLINGETQQQIDLQLENTQLDKALLRLPFYESLLGLSNSSSSISIRRKLIQMQAEFFKEDPNDADLMEYATDIFNDLRNAANAVANGEDGATSDEFSYTNLLIQMNRLIRNLADYSSIKDMVSNLDNLIVELRTISVSEPENGGNQTNGIWQTEWRRRLEDLKAQISALPVYSETAGTEAGTVKVLTESQINILRGYDRNTSSAALDEMLRRYISGHNAIYQGIIYLTSPYKMLAIFALCLALAFDLSGFVFGFVMQGETQKAPGLYPSNMPLISGPSRRGSGKAEWSILDHLCQYRVLTGDFTHRDGTYYCKVFRDGLVEQLEVKDNDGMPPCKQGIYMLKEDGAAGEHSIKLMEMGADLGQEAYAGQELRYSGQDGGPQDGVFVKCRFIYKEGGLSRQDADKTSFICSLEEYVPVHCYSPAEKENRTFPINQLTGKRELKVKIAVVALNKEGSRVSAIYMIKDS